MSIRRISTRIILTVLPVGILSTLALVLIIYSEFNARIEHETEQKMFALLDVEAAKIQEELSKNAAVAYSLVSYTGSASREDFLSGKYKDFMFTLIPTNKNTIGGGIWFEPYGFKEDLEYFGPYVYRVGGKYVFTQMYETPAYDYPNVEWYFKARESKGQICWKDLYYDQLSGYTMLTGAVPFFDKDGVFRGVCSADMELTAITRIVEGISVGETGYAFLIGSKGGYIVFNGDEQTPDKIITEDANPTLAAFGEEIMDNEKGIARLEKKGKPYRIYYRLLPGINWRLAIAISEAEVAAPITGLTTIILLVTALTLGAMIIAVMALARHLRRIIRDVNAFSRRAAEGDLRQQLHLDVNDEFSSIADNLNILVANMDKLTRAKDNFLSQMSHEIRTPMSAISGMIQIAKTSRDPEKIQSCLRKVDESATHLLGVINDILDYSKVSAGKLTLDEKLFSLSENMNFVASMFAAKVADKNIDLKLHLENIEHDGLVTDALRLNQVLINLISNAVKFTENGGFISVTVKELLHEDDVGVYGFSVSDTGIGLDPSDIARLFCPFEQATNKISTYFGGTGLGLHISKNIVEMLGGKITIKSTLGLGSIFSFTIRVKAQKIAKNIPPAGPWMEAAKIPDFSGKHILVVDDLDTNREIIQELFKDTGVKIEAAADGKAAVAKFNDSSEGYYDVILMDMRMPVMDGCTATRLIRTSSRSDAQTVKIIAMTANVLPEAIEMTKDCGMDGHIGKPFDIRDVFHILEEMLNHSNAA